MDDLNTPLNVLVLNDFCHVQGGASKVAVDEAVALAQAGARVTFVGAVGLLRVGYEAHFTPAVEVGWRIARAFWGKGYAPEAAWASICFGSIILTA